ncbi:hypothetical protein NDU88_006675 [Pleurodeles waltl]|uniref:Uncharacterized protein n=1 Tax=Pleurodeles waltl TaxID=8319 RepID=A0AAV7MZW6_PLEWA|nr:hypothetical protein NDU88_006675 [Pleurodeles waltl]
MSCEEQQCDEEGRAAVRCRVRSSSAMSCEEQQCDEEGGAAVRCRVRSSSAMSCSYFHLRILIRGELVVTDFPVLRSVQRHLQVKSPEPTTAAGYSISPANKINLFGQFAMNRFMKLHKSQVSKSFTPAPEALINKIPKNSEQHQSLLLRNIKRLRLQQITAGNS